MTRLNYTGRKISGIKAGQTVSKDLRKRIPPGSASKAAARDPHAELDLSGKQLTDEGFALFIDDLIDCIQYRDDEHPHGTLQLTELSLKGNDLTTASMAKLGPVIALSAGTLNRLDISENDIRVTNNIQRKEWETILRSFQGCYMLKKIDFGGNNLGPAGFDVLARVYTQSDLDFIVSPQQGDHESTPDSDNGENGVNKDMSGLRLSKQKDSVTVANTAQGAAQNDQEVPTTDTSHYPSTRGLRSVPYLVLSNSCTTSACAFHLWNVIMCHRTPDQLLQFLPTGKSMAPQDGAADVCGIVYKPYDRLGPLGQRLLELGAEYLQKLAEPAPEFDVSSANGEADSDEEDFIKKRETERRAQVEMERVKNRLLLDIIKTDGMNSVELWKVAFKMMTVARALLLVKETPKAADTVTKETPSPPQDEGKHIATAATSIFTRFAEEFPSLDVYSRKTERDNAEVPRSTSRLRGRKQRSSSHSESVQRSPSTKCTRVTTNDAVTKITSNPVYAERKTFGLPMELWKDIIARAIEGSEILSEDQQIRILQYAGNWASIEQELRINGGTEFEQQWKILSSMDCLSYQN